MLSKNNSDSLKPSEIITFEHLIINVSPLLLKKISLPLNDSIKLIGLGNLVSLSVLRISCPPLSTK